jgi:hypothetical protein
MRSAHRADLSQCQITRGAIVSSKRVAAELHDLRFNARARRMIMPNARCVRAARAKRG